MKHRKLSANEPMAAVVGINWADRVSEVGMEGAWKKMRVVPSTARRGMIATSCGTGQIW